MFSELDETIRQLLINEGGLDPAEIDVSFEIPNREWSSGISRPTINCYLFDIRENIGMRQSGMQLENQGSNAAARRSAPLRLDLTYLVTAWTRAVEDEHRLLWHALTTLMRYTVLPQQYLQGGLIGQELPIYTSIVRPDGVLKSPGEFWTALENQIKPSLSYVVTLAITRPAVPAGSPVFTRSLRIRTPDNAQEEWHTIAGVVLDHAGASLPGVTLAIEGWAGRDQSDALGRFRLRVPQPGTYTLIARMEEIILRQPITVPSASYDLTFGAASDSAASTRRPTGKPAD